MVALVLLPGLDGTGRLFGEFVSSLGTEASVIVVSYPTDKALGYEALEPIVRSYLPKDRPFILLAESFSGPIAVSLAASQPAGLLGLVLCCSFVSNPLPWLAPFRFAVRVAPVRAMPIAFLSFFLLGRFATPMLRASLAQALSLVAPAVLRFRALAALSVSRGALLSAVTVPVLYLRASEDRVVPPSSSALVVSLAPQTKVVELPAPHFLLQVVPTQAASAVREFVELNHREL